MLSIPAILEKKANGMSFTNDEIEHFIRQMYEEKIHMAQLGAFLMAIKIHGMTTEETSQLTKCMIQYGGELKWPEEWKPILVDKHSTGGIGDKISPILAPLLAACGAKVPMISGRGLGITGGTIDKLETIEGFTAELNQNEAITLLDKVGCFIGSQSKSLVPTDKVMYSIRDITGTVRSIPLIAASIISKKATEKISHLVLDVKYGKASLNEEEHIAIELAKTLVNVSESNGMRTVAMISNMSTPIGTCVGNALEIAEILQSLNGNITCDLKELVFSQASHLLQSIQLATSNEEANQLCEQKIQSGEALMKFRDMLIGQGVNPDLANRLCKKADISIQDYVDVLGHSANHITEIKCGTSGHITAISAYNIGSVVWSLGGGRSVPTDSVDPSVGVVLLKRVGDFINKGDTWAVVHHSQETLNQQILEDMEKAVTIQDAPIETKKLISHLITLDKC